jgi:hypothetical protein
MNESAWETIIDKCPHCNNYISLHHRSTISERHLMELVFRDLIYHKGNECLYEIKRLKKVKAEIEIESRFISGAAVLHKYEIRELII